MNRVKGYRNMVGMTQKEMSKNLGISEGTYRQKEKGKSSFKDLEIKLFTDTVKKFYPDIKEKDIFFS